ncbi:hypothetical protein [Desulfobacula sp.]|uniref:hypothetical protein n=1 Tax=Desulfobacula sp. TaxID=2593537 RepID=UPI002612ACF2|nr:hypothetical protein [Desulfobacula sp.]
MISTGKLKYFVVGFIVFFAFGGITEPFAAGHEPQNIAILQDWQGDYPVSEIHRLPVGMQSWRIGYINHATDLTAVWQVFKPGDKPPEIDFKHHLVLFARNVVFFNRIGIAAVLLKDGDAQVLVRETMSALPIEDRVAMALAVIPAAGVRNLLMGNEKIPIIEPGVDLSADPLNATYIIEGRKVSLHNGYSESSVVPGSAVKMVTRIFNPPVKGDLDGDGDEDAGLILVHNPGGSGTFYYVTAAINTGGQYRSTNTVLLGDRIFPNDLTIVHGVIVAGYKDRGVNEPMTTIPSVEKKVCLPYENERLQPIISLETDE